MLLFGRQLPDRHLRLGQHGPVVRTLQRALRAAGVSLGVNGSFDPRTRRAVRRYQSSQGFHPSGVVNDRTLFFLKMGGVIGEQS